MKNTHTYIYVYTYIYIYVYIYIFFFYLLPFFPTMGCRAPRKGRDFLNPLQGGGKPPHLMVGMSAQYMPTAGGDPSRCRPDPTLLNLADRTRSGVYNVVNG